MNYTKSTGTSECRLTGKSEKLYGVILVDAASLSKRKQIVTWNVFQPHVKSRVEKNKEFERILIDFFCEQAKDNARVYLLSRSDERLI